jgi:tetratricopeptide (TPR) repeat protein
MGKLKILIPVILVVAALAWAVPAILKAMPDRYVIRLPEPLQQLGLPEERAAILPTVERPVAAQNLLIPINEKQETEIVPGTPEAIFTPVDFVLSSDQTTAVANSRAAQPTPTLEPSATPLPSPTPWPLPSLSRLDGFQHKFQSWNNCGPATLAMALTYFSMNITQNDTADVLKPDPEDRNVSPDEMAAYVNEQTPLTAISRADGTREILRRLVANDIPVIIEIGIEPPGEYRWMGWYGHYLLLVAYDDQQEQFWVYDSWFGTSEEPLQNAHPDGRILSYNELDENWPHFNRSYIALFQPQQSDIVASIIGEEMDDIVMWQNALKTVQSETATEDDNAFLWFNLGTIYNGLGQYEEAATAFDQARAIGLPWRMLWYQFGPYEAYYKTSRYEDVLMLSDVTLKDRPYFEESYYYKGLALAALGDEQAARENLEKAIDFNPNFLLAMEALATLP